MNMRISTLITALALVALAISVGAIVTLWARPQVIAAAQNPVPVRQITVVGHGDAKAAPDTAMVQVGVQSEAETSRQALTDNNAKMQTLIAKLKELGVADKDIQTSNLSISPRYDDRGRDVVGYQVSNMVSVKIRNIGQTGELLDKVVDAGANSIYGISFMIDEPKSLEQTARDQAIADARTRAQAMAQSAGGTVGQVISITENIGSTPPPMMRMEAATMADSTGGGAPVQAGEQTINAQVQITFELR